MIDLTWDQSIRPVLLRRYGKLTEEQLREAHAYAYGGCVIQDLGYYPFGNVFFSDLTHYVRAGDFVSSLLRNAHSANELAFAIGALSHYVGDAIGHADATNQSVAIEFPKLAQKYGPSVNYAEGKDQHVRTEFAFDINQLSKRNHAPAAYLDHVGIKVPAILVQKAVFETYGLDAHKMIGDKKVVVRGYRKSVRNYIPEVARAEAILHKERFPDDPPSDPSNQLQKDISLASSINGWEPYRKSPGFRTHVLAGVIFILPKVGSLSMLSIRGPNPQTEALYIDSVNRSVSQLRELLAGYRTIPTHVPNRDLDTGDAVKPGGYPLTDETYAQLLETLTRTPTRPIPFSLKRDILAYYSDPDAPITTKKNQKKWAAVQSQLKVLATMPTSEDPSQVLEDMEQPANHDDPGNL
ncbi:MAG TPA: zinc dependent phospholipase C family protein [Edaphobacter sp.]